MSNDTETSHDQQRKEWPDGSSTDHQPPVGSEAISRSGESHTDETASAESDARSDKRNRARMLKKLIDAFDLDPEQGDALINQLASLLPPQHRMSTGEDVAKRLTDMIESDDRARVPLIFGTSGSNQLDVTSEERFRDNKKLEGLLDDEESLLRTLIANERLRGGLSSWLAEHDAMKQVLVSELARRYSLNEQWRHMLPKYMLPVFSVLHAAGVKRDQLRGKLLGQIIDLVHEHSQTKDVTREMLVAAAKRTDDEFKHFLQEERAPATPMAEGNSPNGTEAEPQKAGEISPLDSQQGNAESIEVAQERLKTVLYPRHAAFLRSNKSEEAERAFRPVSLLNQAGGGLDKFGRPVFESLEEFHEGVKYLKEQKAI